LWFSGILKLFCGCGNLKLGSVGVGFLPRSLVFDAEAEQRVFLPKTFLLLGSLSSFCVLCGGDSKLNDVFPLYDVMEMGRKSQLEKKGDSRDVVTRLFRLCLFSEQLFFFEIHSG
jgi:hypothetical protein